MIPKRVPVKIIEALYKYIYTLENAQTQRLIHHYELYQNGTHYSALSAHCKIFFSENEKDYIESDLDFYIGLEEDNFIEYPFIINDGIYYNCNKKIIKKVIDYFDNACVESYTYQGLEDWRYIPRTFTIYDGSEKKSILIKDVANFGDRMAYVEPKDNKADEETIFINTPKMYSIDFVQPYPDPETLINEL